MQKRIVTKQRLPRIISRAIIITKYVLIVVWNILNLGLIEEFRFLLMGLSWLRKWVRSMWHDCTPTGNMGNDMINILSIWFSHFTVTETHWWYNESLSLHFNKKRFSGRSVLTLCWPIYSQLKPPPNWLITAGKSKITIHIIANHNSYHDDRSTLQCLAHVFCSQLIRNVWICRRIDSSSIIAHPIYHGNDR